jgi:DNA helicase TIP49 (TBP-interacting protein)
MNHYAVKKETYPFKGYVEKISEPQEIKKGNQTIKRAVLTLSTIDEQKMFVELRDKMLERVQTIGIAPGDKVAITVNFLGQEKQGRTFNNIVCRTLDYIG